MSLCRPSAPLHQQHRHPTIPTAAAAITAAAPPEPSWPRSLYRYRMHLRRRSSRVPSRPWTSFGPSSLPSSPEKVPSACPVVCPTGRSVHPLPPARGCVRADPRFSNDHNPAQPVCEEGSRALSYHGHGHHHAGVLRRSGRRLPGQSAQDRQGMPARESKVP